MLTRLQRWLPYPDWKRRELTCGREEELVYRMMTDGVEELLDILNSYRQKKDYYRLKDGSYAEVDEQSMELLAELMDSMHLKPKEFVQGKCICQCTAPSI